MYQKTTLENGIRIATETMPHARSISMGVMIDAGPRDEDRHQCGLAHLSEHLMFQGTSSRNAMQIARLMDGAGGYMGGFTSRDYTYYSASVLADYSTYALDILGDILLNSIFPEESLQREKAAILCEIEASRDNPDQFVHNFLLSSVWPNHSLGRPVAGYANAVREMSREDVIYFVHNHYLPNRIIIAAAGSVDHEDFTAQVRDSFWRMLGKFEPKEAETSQYQSGIFLEELPVNQAYFSIGLRAFPYSHRDRYALHVLEKILGGGISSRLFRRVREERGLVYYIGSEYHAYRDDGMLVVEGATAPENLETVLELTLTEMRKLFTWEEPVDDEEHLRAITQIRGQHIISGESVDTRMSRLATQEFYFGEHITSQQIIDRIDAVDKRLLERICREHFAYSLRHSTVAAAGPDIKHHCNRSRLEKILNGIS